MRSPQPPRRPRKSSALPIPTESEARFEALLRSFGTQDAPLDVVSAAPPASAEAFLDELYARRDEFLERDKYGSIGDAPEFNTKVVGVSFEGRQDYIAGLAAGDPLELVRQPDNEIDPNAIAVHYGEIQVGYLKKEIAKRLAPQIDTGERYTVYVTTRTGGGEDRHHGLNVRVVRETGRLQPRERRARATFEGDDAIRRALIGDREVRPSQARVLDRLAAGRNTLAVMGTGRGKSFCYQLPAARGALEARRKTLVLYPLRALANDQFESLGRKLEPFGLRIFRANGAMRDEERADLHGALADGAWDLVLSTPEFVQFHGEAFAQAHNRPDLVVIDEAHHLAESRHRPAYTSLGDFIATLGRPQILALTATAGDTGFSAIRETLAIDAWVIDPTVRDNLHLVDARGKAEKNAYLQRELSTETKAIVYCNSRVEATKVAEHLRKTLGPAVGFYHAGMGHEARLQLEDYFRSGDVRIVVATSAFGEGIDLPDVRDVVLYHLNFNFTEFNQQAGRAGRDGEDARIHLLYGERDRSLNEYILGRTNPTIETLREIYRGLRGLASDDVLRLSPADIAATLELDRVAPETIVTAAFIFEEAGLAQSGHDEDGRFMRFPATSGKVDLTKTARFAEGLAERDAFEEFSGLALRADVTTLERIVNRPIYPERVPLER
jgi:single-stranded-DNA-specific exonuclease